MPSAVFGSSLSVFLRECLPVPCVDKSPSTVASVYLYLLLFVCSAVSFGLSSVSVFSPSGSVVSSGFLFPPVAASRF